MSREKWFYRGREACCRGDDRVIRDGRLSPESRRQFFEGWDEEDRYLRSFYATPEQVAESAHVRKKLREFAGLMRLGLSAADTL